MGRRPPAGHRPLPGGAAPRSQPGKHLCFLKTSLVPNLKYAEQGLRNEVRRLAAAGDWALLEGAAPRSPRIWYVKSGSQNPPGHRPCTFMYGRAATRFDELCNCCLGELRCGVILLGSAVKDRATTFWMPWDCTMYCIRLVPSGHCASPRDPALQRRFSVRVLVLDGDRSGPFDQQQTCR